MQSTVNVMDLISVLAVARGGTDYSNRQLNKFKAGR
jgi:hypothetical protein